MPKSLPPLEEAVVGIALSHSSGTAAALQPHWEGASLLLLCTAFPPA